jgi:hypothetical protein
MADLLNTADDVSAKGNYDITDVFDNFANGLNGDGTKGDGIKYRVNDGKTLLMTLRVLVSELIVVIMLIH